MATLLNQGLLDGDLVDDTWAVGLLWARVAPAARRERERLHEPRLFENVEALVSAAQAAV